jgi:hypothetical protein
MALTDVPAANENEAPVTLHGVMHAMLGEGLRSHYAPPKILSHQLLVLAMQLKEEERRATRQKSSRKRKDGGGHVAAEMAEAKSAV